MKNLTLQMLTITLLTLINIGCVTTNPDKEATKKEKTIEVVGSSEIFIQPNQIVLNIGLKSRSNTLKNKLLKVLEKHNISEHQITLNTINNNWDWYYYSNREYLNYDVQIDSTVNSEKLMYDLKPLVYRAHIVQKRHTHIQDHIQRVKEEAIKAAKYKASYLLEAVGAELGQVITVQEIVTPVATRDNWWSYQRSYPRETIYSNRSFDSGEQPVSNILQEQLRYEVKVIFEII
ncbi:MAG: SIMPL domain-containing protein [Flavobacteriales bacterium]|jgi:uncharacterized protein YggE|nr:SIMPL domain-containing protein [Flavobacteriales bacterium]